MQVFPFHEAKRFEAAGALVIEFKEEPVKVQSVENRFSRSVVSALSKDVPMI